MNEKKQNLDRYRDLENLIYKGFIPYKTKIGSVNFVFKSISDIEYEQVVLRSGLEKDLSYNNLFHINYFFYSLYFINGVNILEKRDNLYEDIFDVIKNFPLLLITKIISQLEHFITKQNNCFNLIEPYSYEEISRYNWLYRQNISLNDYRLTGIKGTENLGLNQFQKYWTILNLRENQKEHWEENYGLAKFLASFTDPKSVRRMEASDKNKREEEKERRERIKARGTPDERKYITDPTDTAEGLVDALNKQMRGEKDAHDLTIENYERELRTGMLRQMQELKRVQDERRKHFQENPIDETRAVTPEEMAERIRKSAERSKGKLIVKDNSRSSSKFLEMSNITDEEVIKESGLMSKNDYNQIINDDLIRNLREKPSVEEEYLKQQKKLALQYGLEDEDRMAVNFPNLRNK